MIGMRYSKFFITKRPINVEEETKKECVAATVPFQVSLDVYARLQWPDPDDVQGGTP